MESIFIAQLIGLYLLVVGALVAVRRTSIMPAISDLVKNKGLIVALSFIEIAAGLALVLTYPQITFDWMGIVSLVGWMMLVEGIIYLALPFSSIQKLARNFNTKNWYLSGGIIAVILGSYLTAVGFGFLS